MTINIKIRKENTINKYYQRIHRYIKYSTLHYRVISSIIFSDILSSVFFKSLIAKQWELQSRVNAIEAFFQSLVIHYIDGFFICLLSEAIFNACIPLRL